MEDDFCGAALDPTKWVSDVPAPLTFTKGGVTCAGPVALRFRDRLEIGGLNILEQTGISYVSGNGIVGGLIQRRIRRELLHRRSHDDRGKHLSGNQRNDECSAGQLSPNLLTNSVPWFFIRSQSAPDRCIKQRLQRGERAKVAGWAGTTHVVLTMRAIDPANPSTTSTPQIVIYDGTLQNVPAYADYEPLWGLNLSARWAMLSATNYGAVWVQSAAPGQPWRKPGDRGCFGGCGVLSEAPANCTSPQPASRS